MIFSNKKKIKIIALIPARMNSKRLKNKNLLKINKIPLLAYPINAAKKSKYIYKIFVSTDSTKISKIAIKHGAEVPFLRPKRLATDKSLVIDSIIFFLKNLQIKFNYKPDYIVVLQPTNPMIESKIVDSAIEKAVLNGADSVVGIRQVETVSHPYNLRKINKRGTVNFWKETHHYNFSNRSREKFYTAGGIYVTSFKTIISKKRIEGKKNLYVFMDKLSSLDIDTIEDLKLIKKLKSN